MPSEIVEVHCVLCGVGVLVDEREVDGDEAFLCGICTETIVS